MIRYWTISVALILCNGCGNRQVLPPAQSARSGNHTQTITIVENPSDAHREVPMDIIQNVPGHLKLLKPGMAKAEVFKILGLTGYNPVATGSGPTDRYGSSYYLRTNYVVTLTFDETRDSFRSVRLDGDGWKESRR